MVAYSFKRRFIAPILAGTKRQTIRAERKRHARPGEELQLFTGMRTKQCRLLGRATCLTVQPIRMFIKARCVESEGDTISCRLGTDTFACADGFKTRDELAAFWADNHPGIDPFSGVLITWGTLRREPGEVPFQ